MATFAPGIEVPPDHEFAPRGRDDSASRSDDDQAYSNATVDLNNATKEQKITFYEAKAQKMANDNNCGVLCHYVWLPQFQTVVPRLTAVFIATDPSATEPT